jgi:rhamnosyltransferase
MSKDLKKPKIAVLLATYNGSLFIEKQLDSILSQENVDVTIIVNDDFSTDGTYEILSQMSKNNCNIKLLPQKKFGTPTKNFHHLLSSDDFSNYDYVAFSDQDDFWFPDKLYNAHLELTTRKAAGYSSDVIAKYSNGKEIYIKKSYPLKKYDYLFESASAGCTYVFKPWIISEYIEFINEHPKEIDIVDSHDWLIYAYIRSKNYGWYIDNHATMNYLQHENNSAGVNFGLKAYSKRFREIFKGSYRTKCLILSNLFPDNNLELRKLLSHRWLPSFVLLKYIIEMRRSPKDQLILTILIIFGLFRINKKDLESDEIS